MGRKSIPPMPFNEDDLLQKVDGYRTAMAQGDFSKDEPTVVEVVKEKEIPRKQRSSKKDGYESSFLTVKNDNKEQKITVTISKKHHNVITKVLGVVEGNNVKIINYLSNIIDAHFEEYADEINELYKKNKSNNIL